MITASNAGAGYISRWIVEMIVVVFMMIVRAVDGGCWRCQMIILIILPWTRRATICCTNCTSWRREWTLFVVLWYRNFQWRIYHIWIFNGFIIFGRHLKRMINVALEYYSNISAWESERGTEKYTRTKKVMLNCFKPFCCRPYLFGNFNGSELFRWKISSTKTPFLLKHIK